MRLLLFLLACYGTTNIVTRGRICEALRAWAAKRSAAAGYWTRCPMCCGVPVGAAWWLAGLFPPSGAPVPADLLAASAASSGFGWIVHVVLHRLGADEL